MLRRLHKEQPESFAFTPENRAWAEAQITKYPEGRQASAIIPLLWRAQEQEGWLSRPAIEHVAQMLGMEFIRALEVATFYFMFQLQPVGSVAHVQVCGTTSCMICGAEDLIGVCREKIAPNPHELSADGKLSWEEVECLGACANAPMAQIGKDYYEDLTAERFAQMLDDLVAGKVPAPGPQNGRYASEPVSGLTSLQAHDKGRMAHNASVQLATDLGDTVKRIDGTEVPVLAPWRDKGANHRPADPAVKLNETPQEVGAKAAKPQPGKDAKADETGISKREAPAKSKAKPAPQPAAEPSQSPGKKPRVMKAPRKAGADDLKLIKGVGPKLEQLLHGLGFFHFDQVAKWTEEEVQWVDQNLEGFKGRVSRDHWVEQAKLLAEGKDTEFSSRARKGGVD
ncbi:NADH dehydrogenase subunit E [Roseovarius litoreus]|jgi:NADH-quinone oxidoreductase subunit E|uniref:NADH dehydrogenase subunit E n=1 Tax=Roseovarius litoreus TaxID=1155722 RepID=A0A1M7CIU9_9RHOB|nr:NADH-quinone oxidoreductase subunit E [Roseovarius litoreus]SHL67211.1 NADH dehydrogenase subunit E [Roseovarius litoreus]